MEIVSVLKDINIQVLSAEVDTEGMVAHDEFYVSYHGEALSSATKTLVVNALQYPHTQRDKETPVDDELTASESAPPHPRG